MIIGDSILTNQMSENILPKVAARKTKGTLGGWRPGAGRKPTLKDPVRFTLDVEGAQMDALAEIAEKHEASIASLVRDAITVYLKRRRSK